MNNIPPCPTCGTEFDNIFEATEHMLEDGGEEMFDPKYTLANGYSLMLGSLLRCLYYASNNPIEVRRIAESTYATLFAAKNNPSEMRTLVEDIIINEHMNNIDKELRELLDKENKDDK